VALDGGVDGFGDHAGHWGRVALYAAMGRQVEDREESRVVLSTYEGLAFDPDSIWTSFQRCVR
jgi:hypothetical protein